jgi:hypothetical protein
MEPASLDILLEYPNDQNYPKEDAIRLGNDFTLHLRQLFTFEIKLLDIGAQVLLMLIDLF